MSYNDRPNNLIVIRSKFSFEKSGNPVMFFSPVNNLLQSFLLSLLISFIIFLLNIKLVIGTIIVIFLIFTFKFSIIIQVSKVLIFNTIFFSAFVHFIFILCLVVSSNFLINKIIIIVLIGSQAAIILGSIYNLWLNLIQSYRLYL